VQARKHQGHSLGSLQQQCLVLQAWWEQPKCYIAFRALAALNICCRWVACIAQGFCTTATASTSLPAHHCCLLICHMQFLLGGPFYQQAWHGLKYGAANMGLLVALGTSAAYADSIAQLIVRAVNPTVMGHVWFESSVLILVFVAAGKYIEAKAKARTGDAMRSLLQLGARTATLLTPIKPVDGDDTTAGEEGWVAREIPAELVQVRRL
jgi:cation transport ATPase